MRFFKTLQQQTDAERQQLLAAPIIQKAITGTIALDEYIAFLTQAYHHVKHTTPLLMAVGSRLPGDKEWLRDAVAEYIKEEIGHQEWILSDIAACGFDKEQVRNGQAAMPTELMVSYAYDMVMRVNPLGFFGMVQVLEGTSIKVAEQAADSIGKALGLPRTAFTYLSSHGALDQEHMKFFESLMDQVTDSEEQQLIIHSAKVFYKLYGDIFRSLTYGLEADDQQGLRHAING